MKKLLKSLLVMLIAGATTVGATGAYFTSSVSAANNQIIAGTLRLALDSTRTHTTASTWNGGLGPWGVPYDSYTFAYDNNGANWNNYTLEPWQNAAPGPYVTYTETQNGGVGGANLPDGNHSWWISLRNIGSITMKAKMGVNGGGVWTVNPAVQTANPTCTSAYLATVAAGTVTAQNVTFYGTTAMSDICKADKECENIYYGLTGLGTWHYSTDPVIQGSDINVPGASLSTVYASSDGTHTGTPITLKPNEFVIARVDGNFNTSDNCFQGATYTYNVTGNGYQVGDMTW